MSRAFGPDPPDLFARISTCKLARGFQEPLRAYACARNLSWFSSVRALGSQGGMGGPLILASLRPGAQQGEECWPGSWLGGAPGGKLQQARLPWLSIVRQWGARGDGKAPTPRLTAPGRNEGKNVGLCWGLLWCLLWGLWRGACSGALGAGPKVGVRCPEFLGSPSPRYFLGDSTWSESCAPSTKGYYHYRLYS